MAQKLKREDRNLYLDLATGIYHVRLMVNGKPVIRTTGCTTPKKARTERDKIVVQLREEGGERKKVPTLAEWWVDYRKRKTKSPLTWRLQDGIMAHHVLPAYGTERLNDFTSRQMEFFIQKRRKEGASEGTIAVALKVVAAVFNDAVENGVIDRNPLKKVVKEGPKIPVRTRVLTKAEQVKLEAVAVPEAKRFILFLLATGVRLEEAVTVKPSRDFRWDQQEFRVVGKGSKTRWVPILGQSAEALRLIVAEQLELTGKDALWTRGCDALREMVYHACDMAQVPRLGPHVLRHTFATRYLQGNGDIYTLSMILGHSSVKVTEQNYAHLKPRDLVKLSAEIEVGVRYAVVG